MSERRVVDVFEDQGRQISLERIEMGWMNWYQLRFPNGSVKTIDSVAGRRLEALAREAAEEPW